MADLRWFGSTCFRIRGKDAAVLTDPFKGPGIGKLAADVITLSHDAELGITPGDAALLHGPGEYEVRGLFVTGIRTYRDDQQVSTRGHNTVYLIEIDGITVGHLGLLGHALSTDQAEAMANADVLLVPIGADTLDPAKAAEVVARIAPKLVIPMGYSAAVAGPGSDVETFIKGLGLEPSEPEEKVAIRPGDLGETLRLVLLRAGA